MVAEHMWDRHQVGVSEADEAVADIDAVWFDPDPHSRSGRSARVIGYSHSRRTVLTVILVHREGGAGYWARTGGKPAVPIDAGMKGANDERQP